MMANEIQPSFESILGANPPSIRQMIAQKIGIEEAPFDYSGVIDATAETEVAKLLGYAFSDMTREEQDSVKKVVNYLQRNKLMGKDKSQSKALGDVEFQIGKPPRGYSRLTHIVRYVQLQDSLIGIIKHVEELKKDALRSLDG